MHLLQFHGESDLPPSPASQSLVVAFDARSFPSSARLDNWKEVECTLISLKQQTSVLIYVCFCAGFALSRHSFPLRLRPPSEKNFTLAPRRSKPSKYLTATTYLAKKMQKASKLGTEFEIKFPISKECWLIFELVRILQSYYMLLQFTVICRVFSPLSVPHQTLFCVAFKLIQQMHRYEFYMIFRYLEI